MIFGDVPLDQAEGAILAHSMPAIKDGQPYRIAKGTVLTADHLRALADAGREHVVVARLGDDDIEENAAALELALCHDARRRGDGCGCDQCAERGASDDHFGHRAAISPL